MIHYITPKQLYVPPFHFPWEEVLTKVLTEGYFGNYGPHRKNDDYLTAQLTTFNLSAHCVQCASLSV